MGPNAFVSSASNVHHWPQSRFRSLRHKLLTKSSIRFPQKHQLKYLQTPVRCGWIWRCSWIKLQPAFCSPSIALVQRFLPITIVGRHSATVDVGCRIQSRLKTAFHLFHFLSRHPNNLVRFYGKGARSKETTSSLSLSSSVILHKKRKSCFSLKIELSTMYSSSSASATSSWFDVRWWHSLPLQAFISQKRPNQNHIAAISYQESNRGGAAPTYLTEIYSTNFAKGSVCDCEGENRLELHRRSQQSKERL